MELIDKKKVIKEVQKVYDEGYKFLPSDLVESVDEFKDELLRVIDTLETKKVEDAFIDKACEWLSNHVNDYIINDKYMLPNGKMSRDWLKVKSEMFDDFRKYMKGK